MKNLKEEIEKIRDYIIEVTLWRVGHEPNENYDAMYQKSSDQLLALFKSTFLEMVKEAEEAGDQYGTLYEIIKEDTK